MSTPAPVTPTPPAGATVRSLSISGTVRTTRPAKVTFALTSRASVTFAVRCAGTKGCASSAAVRWAQASKAGTRSFSLTRKQNGRLLPVGRYILTLSTPGGSRSALFTVR